MSRTWFTSAGRSRSCPRSATRTSSPSTKVPARHKYKFCPLVYAHPCACVYVCVSHVGSRTWYLEKDVSQSVFVCGSEFGHAKSLCGRRQGYVSVNPLGSAGSMARLMWSSLSSTAPHAWWAGHQSESTSVHVFVPYTHPGAHVSQSESSRGWRGRSKSLLHKIMHVSEWSVQQKL